MRVIIRILSANRCSSNHTRRRGLRTTPWTWRISVQCDSKLNWWPAHKTWSLRQVKIKDSACPELPPNIHRKQNLDCKTRANSRPHTDRQRRRKRGCRQSRLVRGTFRSRRRIGRALGKWRRCRSINRFRNRLRRIWSSSSGTRRMMTGPLVARGGALIIIKVITISGVCSSHKTNRLIGRITKTFWHSSWQPKHPRICSVRSAQNVAVFLGTSRGTWKGQVAKVLKLMKWIQLNHRLGRSTMFRSWASAHQGSRSLHGTLWIIRCRRRALIIKLQWMRLIRAR